MNKTLCIALLFSLSASQIAAQEAEQAPDIRSLPQQESVQAHAASNEQPPPRDDGMVPVDNFYIDIYEYSNQQGALPRVGVTFTEAESLCSARGKRLCTELEWQRAATGPDNMPYGYGPTFESGRCNTPISENGAWFGGASLAACGSFGDCQNAYGIHDMIGNIWEWTSTWYSPQEQWRIVRGGSYFHSANWARADTRYGRYLDRQYRLDLVGFRCCRSRPLSEPRVE